MTMRNQMIPAGLSAPSIPLLDASSLPMADDWALVESLSGYGHEFDPDDDRYAGMSVGADSFD
jgi:hypothetical protein